MKVRNLVIRLKLMADSISGLVMTVMQIRESSICSYILFVPTGHHRWEPAKNFSQCERLVASFWEDVGWDSVDYPEGTEVIPSDTWISELTRQ